MLDARLVGDKVELDWTWQSNSAHLDQREMQVDRGTGWTAHTFDVAPGYADSTPFPATPSR